MSAPAVTDAERAAAGRWLVKHGVEVPALTDLLAWRLGFRGGARPPGSWRWIVPAILVVTAANVGYLSLAFLPGVRGEELTSGAYLFFLMIVMQLSLWGPVRARDRQARALLGIRAIKRAPGPAMGGWDIAALLVTFGGAAALAVTIFVTTPFRTYAVSWLGFLALGGAVTSVILTGILRRPVIAEDETSLAVDAAVRLQDFLIAMPAVYAVPMLFDPIIDNAQPPGYIPWLIGYAALAVATQAVAGFVNWRRRRAILVAVG
ncbi:hypothetical protein H4696_003364 [Amycolatopsis lexingtonensis]|uniref:ABC-2 type transport system permease protein n=1 Tax=Amycolatopsis lexingtonensis TaxID=218822 RepID=A0ABR9HZA0_9PSEU|nr:hypothetical protein [Amycolatopsis lexingtonensis]MBE1496264.1 hypothetical protein [Amycolatopsis lexingtonensis]